MTHVLVIKRFSKTSPQEIREQVDPAVWDTLVSGRAKHVFPMKIRLRPRERLLKETISFKA